MKETKSLVNTNCPICACPGHIKEIWQDNVDFFSPESGYYIYKFECEECGYVKINSSLKDLLAEMETVKNQEDTNPAWKLISAHLEEKLGRKPTIKDVQQFLQKP